MVHAGLGFLSRQRGRIARGASGSLPPFDHLAVRKVITAELAEQKLEVTPVNIAKMCGLKSVAELGRIAKGEAPSKPVAPWGEKVKATGAGKYAYTPKHNRLSSPSCGRRSWRSRSRCDRRASITKALQAAPGGSRGRQRFARQRNKSPGRPRLGRASGAAEETWRFGVPGRRREGPSPAERSHNERGCTTIVIRRTSPQVRASSKDDETRADR